MSVSLRSPIPTATRSPWPTSRRRSRRFDGLDVGDNDGLGSCHTAEIPFVFATTGRPEVWRRIGAHPPAAVTETMHSTWVHFVTSGDPGSAPGTTAYLAAQDVHSA